MEDELRLSLLLIGGCFILAVLAHGMWKIRKNGKSSQTSTKQNRIEPGDWENQQSDDDWDEDESFSATHQRRNDFGPEHDYDDLGLGKVRVVSRSEEPVSNISDHSDAEIEDSASEGEDADLAKTPPQAPPPAEEKLYGSVVSNPKPHMQHARPAAEKDDNIDFPEPPGFLLKEAQIAEAESAAESGAAESSAPSAEEQAQIKEAQDFSLDTVPSEKQPDAEARTNVSSFGEHAKRLVSRKRTKPGGKRRQEPSFGDDQMRIDFDEPQHSKQGREDASAPTVGDQEVLVLNVRAAEDAPISGAALLPMLLTLGFKFGDQDIFHRHVNSNGKGPVLFSLANMFKPGVFDIDNLENFTTQGVSLFMILPIEGDPHQVFNMMHNAARKIADEFSAQVLDGRRSVLTKQGLQQYVEKIREFERQRMISRH